MSYWTEERIATLKTLWKDGVSAGVITKILGAGVSRSAVIGKVHRLGLEKRRSVCRIIQMPRRRVAPTPRRMKTAKPAARAPIPDAVPVPLFRPASPPLRLSLMQLTDQTCKCGLGDPKHADFSFCGLPVQDGSPYCPDHHRICRSTIRTTNAKKREMQPTRHDRRFERWAA